MIDDNSTQPIPGNSRIAKNALMLYIRMFFTMLIGLYTSRVVLATLGEVDYGIYGVVGSIVAMMGFLNASMSGATSRFLTFELGQGDRERLSRTFSSAMIVHIGIALVVFVVAETVGLWFLNHKLVIPVERMAAARWVFHLSVASAMLGITQVPYNSAIIAHERMDVYAYVEILNSVLKLVIVFLLGIGGYDKLVLYAVLYFAVSVLIRGIYRVYCIRQFGECHLIWHIDKEFLKPLLSFSGWTVYTEMAFAIRQSGVGFLLNMFFGIVYNAANGIANVVQGVILTFSSNIVMAFRPQIIKAYATADYSRMNKLIGAAIKMTVLLLSIVTIPMCLNAEYVLGLWLAKVPQGAVFMTQVLLALNLVNTVSYVLMCGIHASGQMQLYSVLTGTVLLLSLCIMYALLKMGGGYEVVFYTLFTMGFVVLIIYICTLKRNVAEFDIRTQFINTILPVFLIVLTSYFTTKLICVTMVGWKCFVVSSALSTFILLSLFLMLLFNKNERIYLKNVIKSKLSRGS